MRGENDSKGKPDVWLATGRRDAGDDRRARCVPGEFGGGQLKVARSKSRRSLAAAVRRVAASAK